MPVLIRENVIYIPVQMWENALNMPAPVWIPVTSMPVRKMEDAAIRTVQAITESLVITMNNIVQDQADIIEAVMGRDTEEVTAKRYNTDSARENCLVHERNMNLTPFLKPAVSA